MIFRASLLVLLLPSVLLGADPPDAKARIPGHEGETAQIVDRALKTYQEAKSYQDHLVIRIDLDIEGPVPPLQPAELTLAWNPPNRIGLKAGPYAVFCDGKDFWEYAQPLEQYTVTPAPKKISFEKLGLNQFGLVEQQRHPVAMLLVSENPSPRDLFPELVRFTDSKIAMLDKQAGKQVAGIVKVPVGPGQSAEMPFEAWFDDKTGLLGEIRLDQTELVRKNAANAPVPVKINKVVQRYSFTEVAVDKAIPDERFVFKPGPYDEKKVLLRPFASEVEWQNKLLGREAIDFNGTDFTGNKLAWADLKGRVVLLDFWSIRCVPCIMAMPNLQRIAERYADKPVSVIGVNTDTGPDQDQAKELIKARKYTYRHYIDEAGRLFEAYRVTGIPCMVLIGKEGLIQNFHVGMMPNEEQLVSKEIDKLLAGENLHPPRTTSPAK